MGAAPIWVLSLAYWLHMLASVTWMGGLAALSILVLPAARRSLQPEAYAELLSGLRHQVNLVGWASLVVLAATGMFQMSANPHYQGFLAVNTRWAVAILIKHLVFLVLVGLSAYLTWGLLPRMQRAAWQARHGLASDDAAAFQRQEALLIRINLCLGLLVLALTALARAS